MKLTMAQLDAFSATIETGTTAGAAIALHTSQPSISRALKQLEDVTRLVLFQRIDNRLRPTQEALQLLEVLQQSYVGMDRIIRAADELRDRTTATLRVGCLPAFSQGFISSAMRRMLEQRNNARVSIRPMLSRDVLSATLTRDIDIGIAAYAVADERLLSEPLVSINEVILCPQSHPLAALPEITPRDLDGHDIVMLDSKDPYRRRFERHMEQQGITCRVRAEVPTSESACYFAAEGVGVALLNPITAIDHLCKGLVIRRYTPNFAFHVSLLTTERIEASVIGKQFLRAVRGEIADRVGRIDAALGPVVQ